MKNNNPLIKKSDKLARLVYKITKKFPKDELYGITSQLRRAALSIPLNITEGFARRAVRSYRQYLYISYGSLKEVKYLLYFAYKERYFSKDDYRELMMLADEIGRMLWVIIKNLSQKIKN